MRVASAGIKKEGKDEEGMGEDGEKRMCMISRDQEIKNAKAQ